MRALFIRSGLYPDDGDGHDCAITVETNSDVEEPAVALNVIPILGKEEDAPAITLYLSNAADVRELRSMLTRASGEAGLT